MSEPFQETALERRCKHLQQTLLYVQDEMASIQRIVADTLAGVQPVPPPEEPDEEEQEGVLILPDQQLAFEIPAEGLLESVSISADVLEGPRRQLHAGLGFSIDPRHRWRTWVEMSDHDKAFLSSHIDSTPMSLRPAVPRPGAAVWAQHGLKVSRDASVGWWLDGVFSNTALRGLQLPSPPLVKQCVNVMFGSAEGPPPHSDNRGWRIRNLHVVIKIGDRTINLRPLEPAP